MLQSELQTFPDKLFASKLISGLSQGFHTGVKHLTLESFESKNLRSALQDPDKVDELLSKEVNEGYWTGPYKTPPFKSYRVSPIGLAEHKYNHKKRLIVDLSAPHEDPLHPSINDLISKEEFSLSYVKIDDAIKIIMDLGQGSWMCKTDVRAAFKIIPIHPSLWHLHGIKWNKQYYFATRLVFGSRSSPKIFDSLAQVVEWIIIHNYGITHTLHLLDDFIAIDHPNSEPLRTMALLTHIFRILGIPLSNEKTTGPTQTIQYLGIILDTIAMEARLPLDKLARISHLLADFSGKRTCTKRNLLSLLGHLVYASRVIIPGRTFMSRLFEAAKKVKKLDHRVTLTSDCKEDLRMWEHLLEHWNGISMFLDNAPISADDLALFTDASGTRGYGGYYQGNWFASAWDPGLLQSIESELSIAFQELYPIVVAAMLWGNTWSRKRILFHCDNLAVVHILNKGRSPCKSIMKLMRRLVIVAANNSFHFLAIHLPGHSNQIADSLSRLDFQKFRRLAPEASAEPCIIPTNVMFH